MKAPQVPTQIYRSETMYTRFTHIVPVGVTASDVRNPSYWRNFAARGLTGNNANNRAGDVIEAVAADGSFEIHFRVLRAGVGTLSLRPILEVGDTEAEESEPRRVFDEVPPNPNAIEVNVVGGLKVEFGGRHKWRVIDQVTKEVIAKDYGSQEEAESARSSILSVRSAA